MKYQLYTNDEDYCLKYLNELFGIKLIILRSELNVATRVVNRF